jgi:tetratricopeptide (TPR) repeat protein
MRNALIACIIVALAGCSRSSPETSGAGTPPASKTPLFDNLGKHHFEITTTSADAQRYFDQGFTLSYAFNHGEAIRSFRAAAGLDPSCAMCYWGIAFALGPNINAPITEAAAKEAYDAIRQARERAERATARERAYIDALSARYDANAAAERAPLDRAYAEAMRAVVQRFPDDLDAATLFAQSLMDTSPWNYWNQDGSPRPFTNDVITALESVLKRQPDHIGAIHMYIHAVEASPNPGRAEPYAGKLAALVPGAGHLVHMPAHTYLRTGRYAEASLANRNAIKADAAYLAGDRAAGNMTYEIGYIPHNMHFLVTSASMEGRRADALAAADQVHSHMHADMLRDRDMGGMVQHMMLTPIFTKVRFGMWSDVLAEPLPPQDLSYMSAIAHAARGMALTATGQLDAAETELAAATKAGADPALEKLYVSSVNNAAAIAAIARDVLGAQIATKRRRASEAVARFAKAAGTEDGLIYMEPPDWPVPVRQLQGVALLELGRIPEAERAFQEDLRKFPENGWSLTGLRDALKRQGRAKEAADVETRLKRAWPDDPEATTVTKTN